MAEQSQLIWKNPAWQQGAHEWIRAKTEQNHIRLIGEIEQPHAYPWSTVMRVETDHGTIFFKATAQETVYETAVTQRLAILFPDCMPELVAVDIDRGWMLMRDSGEQLRASIRPTKDIKPWEPVITRYSELQIELTEHVSDFLALGAPDQRLEQLPSLYLNLLSDESYLMLDQEKGLATDDFQKAQETTSWISQICSELSGIGIPHSLNHGDFHDGNVLVKNDRITFFDWGDVSVTNPFVSLRNVFVSIEIALGLDEYAFTPEMEILLDLYLKPWNKFASDKDIRRAYLLSRPVASVAKALAWHQTISRLDGDIRNEYAWIIPELIREILYHRNMFSKEDL